MNKIFVLLITVLILEAVHTVPTYGKFKLIKTECERNSSITNCVYNVLSNSVSDPACSNDYYKSHICFSTFSTCFSTLDDEQVNKCLLFRCLKFVGHVGLNHPVKKKDYIVSFKNV